MGVADVFTALTEDRPYRKGMEQGRVLHVLNDMVKNSSLDPFVVELLKNNFDEVDNARKKIQKSASEEYEKFIELLHICRL